MIDPDDPPELSPDRVEKEIRVASGFSDLPIDVERVGTFTFAAGIADRFGSGSAFLIGDAAHRVTPRGGTGMNIAIHDGFDLGWKLAFVLNRWTSETLLQSYERERRPVIEHNLLRSVDPNGTHRAVGEGLDADLGGRLRHVWLADGVSTLDKIGPGLTRFGEAGSLRSGPSRIPLTNVELSPIAARSLGVPAGGTLVVRPDGRVWSAASPAFE